MCVIQMVERSWTAFIYMFPLIFPVMITFLFPKYYLHSLMKQLQIWNNKGGKRANKMTQKVLYNTENSSETGKISEGNGLGSMRRGLFWKFNKNWRNWAMA